MSIRTLSNAHLLHETYADNDFTIEKLESTTYYEGGLAIIRISGNPTGITVANHDGNLHALLGERVVVVWRNAILDHLEADPLDEDNHAILSAILDHLEADPLDESNHDDRIDRDGSRWIWCDGCDGFRMDGHEVCESGIGFDAAGVDEGYGPLTFAPRPAPQPEPVDLSDELDDLADCTKLFAEAMLKMKEASEAVARRSAARLPPWLDRRRDRRGLRPGDVRHPLIDRRPWMNG